MEDQANKATEATASPVAADNGTVVPDTAAVEKPASEAQKPADGQAAPDKAAKGTKGKPTTVADEGAGKDERVSATTFPDTWRKDLAGDDEKLLKRLERIADPRGLLDWALNAEKKIGKKGEGLPKPGKDAPPEELKAWREANGVPESPDKYELKLKDNRALGDDDKPVFDHFAKALHAAGASNELVSGVVDAYLDLTEKEQAGILETDENTLAESVRELKEEWGPADYKRNINAVTGLFADAPKGTMESVLGARMENGKKIGGDAAALRFLTKLALEVNPAATFIPDGDKSGKGIDDEIAELTNLIATKPQEYWGNPAKQKRLLELNEAKQRMTARGRAA